MPIAFILENVEGFMRLHDGRAFESLRKQLCDITDAGGLPAYRFESAVLNAFDFGSPQNRRRLFMVGILDGAACSKFAWPEPQPHRLIG